MIIIMMLMMMMHFKVHETNRERTELEESAVAGYRMWSLVKTATTAAIDRTDVFGVRVSS